MSLFMYVIDDIIMQTKYVYTNTMNIYKDCLSKKKKKKKTERKSES